MFTGIVTDVGTVRSVMSGGDRRLEIDTNFDATDLPLGASVCCSGVCLTVIERGADWFAVEASAETLARTTIAAWQAGTRINLERSLKLGDELGGHLVFGHVDGLVSIAAIEEDGDSLRFVFDAPPELKRFVAEKGSVAIDGISLTVNAVRDSRFSVNVIPHTRSVTTLGTARPGDRANFEVDMLARYVARILETG